MAPLFSRDQLQVGIGAEGRVVVGFKRNERVVLCLNQQCGYSDAVEKLVCRLRTVIVLGVAEAERWRGDPVVKIVKRFQPRDCARV